MNWRDEVPVCCIYCGTVFFCHVDELGKPLEEECTECWKANYLENNDGVEPEDER